MLPTHFFTAAVMKAFRWRYGTKWNKFGL